MPKFGIFRSFYELILHLCIFVLYTGIALYLKTLIIFRVKKQINLTYHLILFTQFSPSSNYFT